MSFQLDPFQQEAIRYIEKEHSVLVSAPTGAGKTLIADFAITQAMARKERVIYTAPIKALSNQKYRDFRQSYGEDVGILTGDVSINPDAPIMIMTTEIYRNSLFEDSSKRLNQVAWVIFDEIHYLDDPERGTVWEEAILFTPPEIRILALSATVPNVRELSDWIKMIHERPIAVVQSNHRPVPLDFIFQCQGQLMFNLRELKSQGYFHRDHWRLSSRDRRRGIRPMRAKPNRLDHLLQHLRLKNRLPAIYFAFGRRRAESLAWEALDFNFLSDEDKTEVTELYRSLLERFDLTQEKTALDLKPLVEQGIAFHHAGMLPTLKEVIEQLFTSRLIKLIFTTETFALGINMPARTVVFDELVKFYGTRFKNLTTRDFYQMAGRAGRRGMDTQGFVYIRLHPNDIALSEVDRILHGRPEMIRSQWNTTYATLLNLYRDMKQDLLKIYPKSFHFFQSNPKERKAGVELLERKIDLMKNMGYLNDQGLTSKGEFAASLFGYEMILSELQEAGELEHVNESGLAVLLSALIFEPRKGDHPPHLKSHHLQALKKAEAQYRSIHKMEFRFRIPPSVKPPHFHLAPAVEAWANGIDFDQMMRLTTVDEGEIVRYLRMIIQLLRELQHAAHTSEALSAKAGRTVKLLNRDVVDAEKQLRA